MTTQSMRECMSATLDSANREIAQLLDSARRLSAATMAVDSAQAAWLVYRSAQCDAETAEFAGGTMAPLVALGCHESLAMNRIRVLKAQLGALIR